MALGFSPGHGDSLIMGKGLAYTPDNLVASLRESAATPAAIE
jgi:hypothetical protein